MNTYLLISSCLNFLAAVIQIGFILSSPERNLVRSRYLLFLSTIMAWSGTYTLWRLSEGADLATFYCQLLIGAATFQPVAFLHFCLALSGISERKSVIVGYGMSIAFVCMVPFGLIVDGVSARYGHAFWPNAGPVMPLYLLHFCGYLLYSVWLLFRGWRRHLGGRASDHMLVLVSGGVGFIGGGTNFPLWYDIPIQPYGNILVSVYLLLMLHGIINQRIFGYSMDFYKALVWLTLNLSSSLFYLLFLALYRNSIGQPLDLLDFWAHGVAAFLVSVVIFWGVPRMKFHIEEILQGVLRRDDGNALAELQALPSRLSDLAEEEAVFEVTVDNIAQTFNVSGVAIYIIEPFSNHYTCEYQQGAFSEELSEFRLAVDNPIIDALSRSPECLVLNQAFGEYEEAVYEELLKLYHQLGLSVIVPIFANHEVYGLIFIGELAEQGKWMHDEVTLLFSIGAQIGMNMRVRDFERRSSEVDKLVSLGTMAAGLAHEIRNPLVSVQTLASLMRSGKSLERMPDDFKNVILRDVKRIESIVDGVAMYSKNQKGKKQLIAIEEVLQSSLDISRKDAECSGVDLVYSHDGNGDALVRCNAEQLVQVFVNLVENAVHALNGVESPEVQVELRKRELRRRETQEWVEVMVSDNGAGVPEAIMEHIFDPFITSKDTGNREEKKGMGLGLAICKRIIENHNGAITVTNNPAGGATFVVSLKCTSQS